LFIVPAMYVLLGADHAHDRDARIEPDELAAA
jgi:hypothetical protein